MVGNEGKEVFSQQCLFFANYSVQEGDLKER